jgi:hypothetical protein
MMGDPPLHFLTRSMRRICALGAGCDYLAHHDMKHSTPPAPCSFPQHDRGAVFELVTQTIENAN